LQCFVTRSGKTFTTGPAVVVLVGREPLGQLDELW
jgi:hypothetical protein